MEIYSPIAEFNYKPLSNLHTRNIMKKLYKNNNIEVRSSKLHGYGVFAKKDIKSGELLEECHYITVEDNYCVNKFMFNWPRGENCRKYVLALGYGSIYNSVSKENNKNTNWKTDIDNDILVFYTTKLIKKDEEILIFYNY